MAVGMYTPDGHMVLDIGLAFTGNTENPPILAPFLEEQPQLLNTIAHKSISNFVHEVTESVPDGYRHVTATITFKNDLEILKQVQAATDVFYQQIKDKVPGLDWMFSHNPQPKVLATHSVKRGGNSLGLAGLQLDQICKYLISGQ